jgi:hypothetical protein
VKPIELWRVAREIEDGHVRLAGPWQRWQPTGASGWYRPALRGGVAVRTDFDTMTPYRWAAGSAGPWYPSEYARMEQAKDAADAYLVASGWVLCDEGDGPG